MTKPDTLLLYSGGIDSVQALYARAKAGVPTRVHHVRLANWEGRLGLELAAVRATLAWIEKRYPGMVEYTSSGFDYGDLKYVVRDHNIWGLMAGIILANPKNAHITKVIRTFHRDSVKGGLESAHGRAAEAAWSSMIERMGRETEFVYPQLDMTKSDIMGALPADLLALTWYCRKPRAGKPCHECHTCKQVDAVIAGDPLEPLSGAPVAEDAPARETPAKSASRKVWAEYADAVGIDTDGMTRAQIVAAVGAL